MAFGATGQAIASINDADESTSYQIVSIYLICVAPISEVGVASCGGVYSPQLEGKINQAQLMHGYCNRCSKMAYMPRTNENNQNSGTGALQCGREILRTNGVGLFLEEAQEFLSDNDGRPFDWVDLRHLDRCIARAICLGESLLADCSWRSK
jgi:hypothetical protein